MSEWHWGKDLNCQSVTFDGRVKLGQKGEKVYLHEKDHNRIFWRVAQCWTLHLLLEFDPKDGQVDPGGCHSLPLLPHVWKNRDSDQVSKIPPDFRLWQWRVLESSSSHILTWSSNCQQERPEKHLNMKILVSKFVLRDLKARRTLDLEGQQHGTSKRGGGTSRRSNIGQRGAATSDLKSRRKDLKAKITEDLERQQDGNSRQRSTDKALVQCSSLEVPCYQMGPQKEIIKHKM